MTVKLTIPGVPVGKGRPRHTKTGHVYTPEKTKAYEERVRLCWLTQGGKGFAEKAPVFITIRAYFPIPKSYSKKRRSELEGAFHMSRPDADNIAKAVLDGLNGLAYPDDAAVQIDGAYKLYTNGAPRVEVTLHDGAAEQEMNS